MITFIHHLDAMMRQIDPRITADQLVLHGIGDYLTQSDWMANEKTKRWFPAGCHATLYSLPFLAFSPSLAAFAVIIGTHYLIDRYRLARYVVWAKNFIAPRRWWTYVVLPLDGHTLQWSVSDTASSRMEQVSGLWWHAPTPPLRFCPAGYPPTTPPWLAFWLLIIADNILHVCINGAALRWL